jgi:manganese transport protein
MPRVGVPHDVMKTLGELHPEQHHRIAITIDFTNTDTGAIRNAIAQGGTNAEYLLIHVVETAGALILGSDIKDYETGSDFENLEAYAIELRTKGYRCNLKIGYGNPKRAIPQLVKEFNADLLVMGAHGHHAFMDLIFGTTINTVRHRVKIPVMIVR